MQKWLLLRLTQGNHFYIQYQVMLGVTPNDVPAKIQPSLCLMILEALCFAHFLVHSHTIEHTYHTSTVPQLLYLSRLQQLRVSSIKYRHIK